MLTLHPIIKRGMTVEWEDGHGVTWRGVLIDADRYGALIRTGDGGSSWSGRPTNLRGARPGRLGCHIER